MIKKKSKHFILFIFFLLFVLGVKSSKQTAIQFYSTTRDGIQIVLDRNKQYERIERLSKNTKASKEEENRKPREGSMVSLIKGRPSKITNTKSKYQYTSWSNKRTGFEIAVAGRDIHKKNYFVNGYLLGFKPFETDQAWFVPLAIAKRTVYRYDKKQFGQDTWLTAAQLWNQRKGDCEDHAIAIADWLIEMGHDARVVLGMTERTGHAWVAVFEEDIVYVIEATAKSPKRIPPRQEFVTDLFPQQMFNRDFLWHNKGGSTNLDYLSKDWIKTSKFVEKEKFTTNRNLIKNKQTKKKFFRKKIQDQTFKRDEINRDLILKTINTKHFTIVPTKVFKKPNFKSKVLFKMEGNKIITPLGKTGIFTMIQTSQGQIGYIFTQDITSGDIRNRRMTPRS